MQEDKDLKDLLMKWAVECPSADFTSRVMQRVASASVTNPHTAPLLKQRLPQIVAGIFLLICIALLALCITTPVLLPFQFTVSVPARYLSQGFSFLVAFWVVMLFHIIPKRNFIKL